MKIYFLFLKTDKEDILKAKWDLPDADSMASLNNEKAVIPYAWTSNNDLLKLFLKTRNQDKFITKTYNNDFKTDKELSESNHGFMKMELKLYNFKENDTQISIPLTKNEIDTLDEYDNFSMSEVFLQLDLDCDHVAPPLIFKDKILNTLDLLGYLEIYTTVTGLKLDGRCFTSEEDEMEYTDNMMYYKSYGLTPLGQRQSEININKFNVFMKKFGFTIF